MSIYSSNYDGDWSAPHVRHRKFSTWIARNAIEWKLVEKVPNRHPFNEYDQTNTSFADFYVYERQKRAAHV
jgi:hypothetical protein